jgi:hypothetical protein
MVCPDDDLSCKPGWLCEGCRRCAEVVLTRQARVLGAVWAERIARVRGWEPEWPSGERAWKRARELVTPMAGDARLEKPLAAACMDGAAAWWAKRPERYRVVRLETSEAEIDECMVAGCEEPVRWSVRGTGWDDYARVCDGHRAEVEREGDEASEAEG